MKDKREKSKTREGGRMQSKEEGRRERKKNQSLEYRGTDTSMLVRIEKGVHLESNRLRIQRKDFIQYPI